MRAFVDTCETKEQALARACAHREADRFVKGRYWEDGKGCSVGCMMQPFKQDSETWHEAAARVHGIPVSLAFLQDRFFEGLPNKTSMLWTERFYNAIPPGADLELVVPRFLHWLLTDPDMIRKHADEQALAAIDKVAALYERRLKGDSILQSEWAAAYRQADDARWAAARFAAAADAARWAAAAAAADADADADADAAAAAARWAAADARWDAADAAYQRMADKLIELIEAAPVDPEKRAA